MLSADCTSYILKDARFPFKMRIRFTVCRVAAAPSCLDGITRLWKLSSLNCAMVRRISGRMIGSNTSFMQRLVSRTRALLRRFHSRLRRRFFPLSTSTSQSSGGLLLITRSVVPLSRLLHAWLDIQNFKHYFRGAHSQTCVIMGTNIFFKWFCSLMEESLKTLKLEYTIMCSLKTVTCS